MFFQHVRTWLGKQHERVLDEVGQSQARFDRFRELPAVWSDRVASCEVRLRRVRTRGRSSAGPEASRRRASGLGQSSRPEHRVHRLQPDRPFPGRNAVEHVTDAEGSGRDLRLFSGRCGEQVLYALGQLQGLGPQSQRRSKRSTDIAVALGVFPVSRPQRPILPVSSEVFTSPSSPLDCKYSLHDSDAPTSTSPSDF